MSHFCLLSDAESYKALDWDLLTDDEGRRYWLDHFESHFEEMMTHAVAEYGRVARKRVAQATRQFSQAINDIRSNPSSLPGGKLDIIELDSLRGQVLRKHDLIDPFARIKNRENTAATELYPQVVRKLHSMDGEEKWLHLVQCVFAGNIFDLGSMNTMHLATNETDFLAAVENTKPRPWLVDDYDRLVEDIPDAPPAKWAKAVVFVDNAGTDLILGVMPFVRELALYGTKIVLAANEHPSLNDITADETAEVVERLAAADDDLAVLVQAGMIEVVSTGNDIPMIDLSEVSDELNEAAADADLVILEGMGRAVETNFDADFKVDALKLALLKDAVVAGRIGGEVYDCVCKYSPR